MLASSRDPIDDSDLLPDTDLCVQEILLAASQHDLTTLRHFLRLYSFSDCESVDVQDPETGFTPLHAAVAACEAQEGTETETPAPLVNAHHSDPTGNGVSSTSDEVDPANDLRLGAQDTIRCLLQNGAIWNQLDKNDETAGCIANRLGLRDLYEMMVDAGVRAELLLNRLEGYEQLEDSDEAETGDNDSGELNGASRPSGEPAWPHAPVNAEADVSSAQYLSSTLSLGADRILDEQCNGVMMSWESGIMSRSANALLTAPQMKVLNIGFGMGLIDNFLQTHSNQPASHHIVEAHPTVLAAMKAKGWYDKAGVVVHEGKWQDILARLVVEGQMFDAIYYDTFAESYSDFHDFFAEQVIGLLDPAGKFSFFNGFGADRQISYDVYQKVVEMDLFEAGFDIDWQEVDVPKLDSEWEGVKRRYWNIERYRLPTCRFMD
jgi:type IV protein arginine methyltransferase